MIPHFIRIANGDDKSIRYAAVSEIVGIRVEKESEYGDENQLVAILKMRDGEEEISYYRHGKLMRLLSPIIPAPNGTKAIVLQPSEETFDAEGRIISELSSYAVRALRIQDGRIEPLFPGCESVRDKWLDTGYAAIIDPDGWAHPLEYIRGFEFWQGGDQHAFASAAADQIHYDVEQMRMREAAAKAKEQEANDV